MMGLGELKKNLELIEAIDWDMTPEEAVRLYLEWGNNWSRGYHMIRSKNDVSHYFVLNTWEEDPIIYFVRRNSEGSVELAKIEVPPGLKKRIRESTYSRKGIYAVEDEVKDWLKEELNTE
ncbi:MAG: DVU0772 family protein [Desulfatiglandaceae bacterium]|jgi:hypothetical protein